MGIFTPLVIKNVLGHLQHADLQNAMLVSKAWLNAYYACPHWRSVVLTLRHSTADAVCRCLAKVHTPIETVYIESRMMGRLLAKVLPHIPKCRELTASCNVEHLEHAPLTLETLYLTLEGSDVSGLSRFQGLCNLHLSYSTNVLEDVVNLHLLPPSLRSLCVYGMFERTVMCVMPNLEVLKIRSLADATLTVDLELFPCLTSLEVNAQSISLVGGAPKATHVRLQGDPDMFSNRERFDDIFPRAKEMHFEDYLEIPEKTFPHTVTKLTLIPCVTKHRTTMDLVYMEALKHLVLFDHRVTSLRVPIGIRTLTIDNSYIARVKMPYGVQRAVHWAARFTVNHDTQTVIET